METSAEESAVQRMIDDFWNDKENRMKLRLYSLLTELSLFGEQFVRFFVDPLRYYDAHRDVVDGDPAEERRRIEARGGY